MRGVYERISSLIHIHNGGIGLLPVRIRPLLDGINRTMVTTARMGLLLTIGNQV